jgi:hypothetical protein
MPAFEGERTLVELGKYIDEQATAYARGKALNSDENDAQDVFSSGFGRPNPDGKVIEVTEATLDVLKSNGPVLLDFYAPWCTQSASLYYSRNRADIHSCKKLRPCKHDREISAGVLLTW